jgi:ribosomal protein S8
MICDTIGDMLTRIRNGCLVKKKALLVPFTRLNLKIVEILEKEGFIHSFEKRNIFFNSKQRTGVLTNTRGDIKGIKDPIQFKNVFEERKIKKLPKVIFKDLFTQMSNVEKDLNKKISSSNNRLNSTTYYQLKIYLKYYKKYQTKFYKLNRKKNPKTFSDFKNLMKLLRGKSGRQKVSCITNLKRISKPGLRIYVNQKEIPRILGGTGIVLLSTSKGILTDREARFRGVGGEVLCSIW